MRPDDRELDDEIRGHLALSVKERVENGEDPEAARLAAMRELGYIPAVRESMRRVWFSRWFDAAAALGREMRVALRSLRRAKGLSATVVVTLALGIGANAAIFSVVRGVLLRPLVNRDEDRLIYIRQGGPGIGAENMTFSVPEIDDVKSRVTTVGAFGDFSTVNFTMIGLGEEPRVVKAGVVNGSFFDVMGLRPVLGRLLTAQDDGPRAAGTVVLTHRFWTTSLGSDPAVIGKTVRLGPRAATVVGVLEPSVPYPADTEIIANVVTSPHHLGATMVTNRSHRMTELFGRLAPGISLEQARAELTAVHAAIVSKHPEAYSPKANVQLSVSRLRDQIAAPARTILIVLLAAAAVVFVIACSNVANLILARSVRREGELAVRAALGAGPGALRRTLLAESLVLCGAGAALGVVLARPFVAMVSSYAARFSVRALEVTVDPSVLWIAAGLAMAAAVLLAYVPRLPSQASSSAPSWLRRTRRSLGEGGPSNGTVRITPSTNRRLRIFATMQIAFSFVLLAGAGMLLATLVSLQTAQTGYDMRQVLAFNIPSSATGLGDAKAITFYQEATRRISELPGVEGAAMGSFVPWRDAGSLGPGFLFTVEGYTPADGEENPRGRMRMVGPRFFAVLGVPIVAGRDFTDADRRGSEPVTIVSESVARRLFGGATGTERERVEVARRGAGGPADPIGATGTERERVEVARRGAGGPADPIGATGTERERVEVARRGAGGPADPIGATGTERERVEVARRGAGGPADPIGATGTERERVEVARRGAGGPADPIKDAVNRHLTWTDPVFSIYGEPVPARIVGVVADVDDENVVPEPALTIYRPAWQIGVAGRLFVRAAGDPYVLVPAVTRVIREISAEQPVERAATLEDVRAEVLSPERLNAFVFSGFAGIALLIAVVGVAGVLAFSVSARTREFGVRLAVGSAPRHLVAGVLREGVVIAAIGIAAGAAGGYVLARVAAGFFSAVQMPGALPVVGAAVVLIAAATCASLIPAARASRVDVLQALRSE